VYATDYSIISSKCVGLKTRSGHVSYDAARYHLANAIIDAAREVAPSECNNMKK